MKEQKKEPTDWAKVFKPVDAARKKHQETGEPYPQDPSEIIGENPGLDVPGEVLIKKEGDFSRLLKIGEENKKTVIFVGSAILLGGALGLALIGKREHLKNLPGFDKKLTPKP